MGRPRRGTTTEERIFDRIEVGDCWEWQGYRMPAGHGRVRVNGTKVLVHRWVWEYLVGPIPAGLELDHLCRNPPCTNPDHLEPVTHRVNTLRGVGVGARNSTKTHCPKGHSYSSENTYVDNLNRRVCKTCVMDRQRIRRSNQLRGVTHLMGYATYDKSIDQMTREVRAVNVDKGWRSADGGPGSNTFGDYIALLHTELSEALEAYRDWRLADATGSNPDGPPNKPEGVGSEFADVLIRLLDTCDVFGIDLAREYDRKIAYNQTRPYQHGGRTLADTH